MRVPSVYDITLKQGVVTRGYLLARQGSLGRGTRRWSVEAVGASIAQQTPTEARYGNQPAIIELPMVFRSTHKGYGDSRVMADDRYHYSLNVDGRFPQQVIAGPLVNEVATHKDFEVTITDNTETISTAFQSGELFAANGGAVPGVGDYFEVLGLGDFTADDLETAKGSAVAANDFFEVTNNGLGMEAVAYLGLGANCVGFFEQDGMLFFVGGRKCLYLKTDGASGIAKDFGAGEVATDCVMFDGKAYVGLGYGTAFHERASNADPTLGWSQAAALYMGYISPFKDRLWASTSIHEVKCVATAPKTAANWSCAYGVGDPGKSITSLAELAELLYVGKTNGLFVLDSSGLGQMATPELGSVVSSANCVNMRPWHGSMWVPHERGLFNYRAMGTQGFLVTPATPGAFAAADNPIKGKITALVGDDRWLYAALYTADGDTYILAGRQAMGDEQAFGPMIWHPLAKLTGKKCDAMHISGLWTNPRLFLSHNKDVAYIILPRKGENPVSDTAYRYALSGSIYYPAHCWLSPTTKKLWKSIEIEGSKITSARYIDVYYCIDEGVWLKAGTANRSPRDIVALPAAGVGGTKIEIRLDLTLPDATQTPRIYSVVVRGVERPPTIKVITVAIRCADNMRLNSGRPERRTGAEILTELEALAQLDEAVILRDTIGVERWVLVLPPIGEVETVQRDGQKPEKVAMVRMAVFEAQERPGAGGAFVIGSSKIGSTDVIV